MQQNSSNVVWHPGTVTRQDREELLEQKGIVLWFTGLSGSGKSSLANQLGQKLFQRKKLTYILDGDNIRHGINGDLGFAEEDRKENIRRVGEIAKLFVDAGVITLVCLISPFREDREKVRGIVGTDFVEIFVDCPLDVCEARDPKSLYKKARSGEIKDFTGISSPYEPPENPEVTVKTDQQSVEECVEAILQYLHSREILSL